MTEEIRPICLYVETCLDRKEGTRDCAKCEHHLNYWTEVMIRDMEKTIIHLEQERNELKFENDRYKQLLKGCPAEDEDCGFCEIDKQNKELKQENKDFEILAKSLYKRIEELEKENEALAFRERLYKADYEASEQENKELKEENKTLNYQWHKQSEIGDEWYKVADKYKTALEEIRNYCDRIEQGSVIGTQDCVINSIKNITNEVLE